MVELMQLVLIVIGAAGNYNILYVIYLICIYLQADHVIHLVYFCIMNVEVVEEDAIIIKAVY